MKLTLKNASRVRLGLATLALAAATGLIGTGRASASDSTCSGCGGGNAYCKTISVGGTDVKCYKP